MKQQNLNVHLRHLAVEYAEILQRCLGEQLVSVVLFGSVARGEAGPTSDIDLLIVVEEAPKGMLARRALIAAARRTVTPRLEALWQQGIFVDFVEIIRSREEAQHFHPVYLGMMEDAVILYDKGGFFRYLLQDLAHRLQSLGAHKKRAEEIEYWILKPDVRAGEVFEI